MASHRLITVAMVMFVCVGVVSLTVISVKGNNKSGPTNKGRNIGDKLNDFHIVWNVPSQRCLSDYGVDVGEDKFGIITNKHGDGWKGEKVTIFYRKLGLYPLINETSGDFVNGGLPQLTNWTYHWRKTSGDIKRAIPDKNFKGYAVLDYEYWRPLYVRNFGHKRVYKKASVELVKKRYPCIKDKSAIEILAIGEFNRDAKKFMLGTLKLAKKLRPNAKWGYYHFANCYKPKGSDSCTKSQEKINDRLDWLLDASDVYYPSGYLGHRMNRTVKGEYVKGQLEETMRMRKDLSSPDNSGTGSQEKEIMMYSRIRYRYKLDYYDKEDLNQTIGQAYRAGVEGVVIWENHRVSQDKQSCLRCQRYVKDVLGPFVQNLNIP